MTSPEISMAPRIYYEIASHCNFSCFHCSDLFHAGKNLIDSTEMLRFHKSIAGKARLDSVVTGGEPTLHNDFDKLVSELAQTGQVVVTTNGSLMSAKRTAEIIRYLHPNIVFQVSMDGASKEVFERIRGDSTYDQVIAYVEQLSSLGVGKQIGLSMTPMRSNMHEIPDVIDLALRLNLGYVHFPSLVPVGVARNNWKDLAIPYEDQSRIDDFLVKEMMKLASQIEISVNALGQALARSRTNGAADCLNIFSIKVDASGNVLPCPTTANRSLSVGRMKDIHSVDQLLERLRNRREDYNALKGGELSGCSQCSNWLGCQSRFCENCGLLAPPDSKISEDACKIVARRHFKIRSASGEV